MEDSFFRWAEECGDIREVDRVLVVRLVLCGW